MSNLDNLANDPLSLNSLTLAAWTRGTLLDLSNLEAEQRDDPELDAETYAVQSTIYLLLRQVVSIVSLTVRDRTQAEENIVDSLRLLFQTRESRVGTSDTVNLNDIVQVELDGEEGEEEIPYPRRNKPRGDGSGSLN